MPGVSAAFAAKTVRFLAVPRYDGSHFQRFVNRQKAQQLLNMVCSFDPKAVSKAGLKAGLAAGKKYSESFTRTTPAGIETVEVSASTVHAAKL